MKLTTDPKERTDEVTPYAGVWIETLWEALIGNLDSVTPYAGVWIETARPLQSEGRKDVTPYAGVWIETLSSLYPAKNGGSHSLRGSVD